MKTAGAELHEDVADTTEIAIEIYLRTQGAHVLFDRCIQISRKEAHMVKMDHQFRSRDD